MFQEGIDIAFVPELRNALTETTWFVATCYAPWELHSHHNRQPMRYVLLSLCSLFLGTACFAQGAVSIARQYSDAVVMIVVQDAQHQNLALGSGLVIESGKVLTNKHVIEGARYAFALSAGGKKFTVAGIHALDSKNDLTLLSIPGLQASTVKLSHDSVEIGQRVYAIGNPEGLANTISEGIISGRRTLQGNSLYQITAPISPGSSGGPIVDEQGAVVGIAVGAFGSGQNLNFAIPIALADPLLSSTTTSPLNVAVRKPAPAAANLPIPNALAVKVHEVKYQTFDYGNEVLDELQWVSILNESDYTVENVRVMLILYDATGQPIDHLDMVLCNIDPSRSRDDGCHSIPPGLAKSFDLSNLSPRPRLGQKRRSEKVVARVLDYTIVKD